MRLYLFLVFMMLVSCNSTKILPSTSDISTGPTLSNDMNKFLQSFEKIVISGKYKGLQAFIDTDYKVEQLGNLSGNMDQFINELFCGDVENSNTFKCLEIQNIKAIRLREMISIADDLYQATYLVSTNDYSIIVNFDIRKANNNPNSGYGFIGAYG